jgi:ubiquinone biosynthesis protein COQ9
MTDAAPDPTADPTEDPTANPTADAILDAALPHVPFEGWSAATLRQAARDAGVAPGVAAALFPRGAVDLALAFHRRGDARMVARLAGEDLGALRFRARIARAVRLRLELVEDREAVRRGVTLFALPHHAADGAKAVWGTADAIWRALGDTSEDLNWYTKRATLSGVYGATVLYWLGDDSTGHQATWEFLDRRIEDVMQVEKVKGMVGDNALGRKVGEWMAKVRPPRMPDDLPGGFGRGGFGRGSGGAGPR